MALVREQGNGFYGCRWQKLNSSLERVSAVHDGCLDGQQEQDKPAGLVLDAVHDVTMSQGWVGRMTQIPSGEQAM